MYLLDHVIEKLNNRKSIDLYLYSEYILEDGQVDGCCTSLAIYMLWI